MEVRILYKIKDYKKCWETARKKSVQTRKMNNKEQGRKKFHKGSS